jgi:hypothetical protein
VRGEIDAFVHDEPILAWEIAQVPGVTLTPVRFAPQDYAIVLPPDAPRREAVNRALLEVLAAAGLAWVSGASIWLWMAAIAVGVNALVVALLFRSELARLPRNVDVAGAPVPVWVGAVHALLLFGVVALAHHPAAFMGLLLLFMGIATAYPQFQDRLILRVGLLVAFFLAGLVVLGGQQQWWLEPLLHSMNETTVYFGATALTAITDNAALTYLGSQVEGLSEPFKQALVAGAVTGGGLTVIANAPNPAGFAILRGHFEDGAISPLGLFAAALPPTIVAILAFRVV